MVFNFTKYCILNSKSLKNYYTDNSYQIIYPVVVSGASVILAYNLGVSGISGSLILFAIIRYNNNGTQCVIDYIFNKDDSKIICSISDGENIIKFSQSYMRIAVFDIK